MCWIMGLVSIVISWSAVLAFHPFENEVANAVCFPLLNFIYVALLLFAEHCENKLEKRIEELEKKLDDKKKGGAG